MRLTASRSSQLSYGSELQVSAQVVPRCDAAKRGCAVRAGDLYMSPPYQCPMRDQVACPRSRRRDTRGRTASCFRGARAQRHARGAPAPSARSCRYRVPNLAPHVCADAARVAAVARAQLASRRPRGALRCVARCAARMQRQYCHASTSSHRHGHAYAATPRSARVAARAAIARSEFVGFTARCARAECVGGLIAQLVRAYG